MGSGTTAKRAQSVRLLAHRYNNNAEALKNMGEVTFFNHFKEIVLTAERALLYTLGFQLGVQHPYYWMRTITKRLAELPGDGQFWKEFESKTVSACFQAVCALRSSASCRVFCWESRS